MDNKQYDLYNENNTAGKTIVRWAGDNACRRGRLRRGGRERLRGWEVNNVVVIVSQHRGGGASDAYLVPFVVPVYRRVSIL